MSFCRDKRNCPYKAGVRIKRVSVEPGSTVFNSMYKVRLFLMKSSASEPGLTEQPPYEIIQLVQSASQQLKVFLSTANIQHPFHKHLGSTS